MIEKYINRINCLFNMLRIQKLSEVLGKKVYTDTGDIFGDVEEVNLGENKIEGWRIRVGMGVANILGGARGVIIPHQFVKAIGDVMVISRSALPIQQEEEVA